ncbi:MAG: hypothetical protein CVT62_09180 [Actinobacteria bacterium HGW-Actinobacteria-2]|nr:MAG: hypothetical protein CVT62_09180 [Actinobacteria bacterium HGW-Actinobacteria-2]
MKRRWILPVVWVAVLFATIGIAQAVGGWQVSGREPVVAGTMTPDDLKGWMTVQQGADGLSVPATVILTEIGGEPGLVTPATAFKDVEALVPEFSLDDLKTRLWEVLGTSPSPTPSSTATTSAAPVPTSTPTGTPPSGVTGQQTLRQVAEANGLELAALIAESGLPTSTDPDTALRALRDTVPGFEIQQVRDAVDRLR